MKIKFLTLGCKVNQVETEAMQRLFELAGHAIVDAIDEANAVVINTCAVTATAAQKSRQMIHRAARQGKVIAVVGCYAQSNPKSVDADVVIGTKDRRRIVELVERAVERKRKDRKFGKTNVQLGDESAMSKREHGGINIVGDVGTTFEELPHLPSKTRAFLKIEDGCDNRCSYCIIPKLRGTVRSRSLDSLRAECRQLRELGFREIVLTGIHLGAYGKDCGLRLIDAVNAALESGNPARLRLSSIEATEVHEELIELLKNDRRMCRHLHLPLQSGCDEVLRAMHRPYSTRQFATLIERLAIEIPNIAITTDLIVGFPGETNAMFEQSIQFVESMPFSKLHVFPYSMREGTPAAERTDRIDPIVKRERAARMIEISNRKSLEYRRKFLGTSVEVLTETSTDGIVDGLTDNYIRVFIDGEAPLGELVNVRLVDLKNDGVEGVRI